MKVYVVRKSCIKSDDVASWGTAMSLWSNQVAAEMEQSRLFDICGIETYITIEDINNIVL